MSLVSILSKIFGTKQDKDMKKLRPLLAKVNNAWDSIKKLSDEELQSKTAEFKERLAKGETLDDILPEAFSVVREATHRILGDGELRTGANGEEVRFMAHFDVQVIAAIVLHQGNIAEMKTGEGKTQVGPMAAYLNALSGKGVHVITVNDYLAKRDSEWMGRIFNFLGLTVGCLDKTEPGSEDRREAYACDITYGTNNEFGFDYLRENMAQSKEALVQRELNYAIIDEVDNILIDEARTPLIISGPSNKDNKEYNELEPAIKRLVQVQRTLIADILSKIEAFIKDEEYGPEFGKLMLVMKRGAPKHPRFIEIMKSTTVDKAMRAVEAEYLRERKLHLLNEELFYAIDENGHSAEMTEKGRTYIGGDNADFFLLPDLSVIIGEINTNAELSDEEKNIARDRAQKEYAMQAEKIHCVSQLLRAHALFENNVDYVVKDGQVQIVDEFTGRILSGRRYSDGLHQALEAKEGLRVQGESQTLATITFQNFFKMYNKVAGMTGTAATEAKEFIDIYELDVVQVPTNKPIIRKDMDDLVYKTEREKFNALVDDIKEAIAAGRPCLVGTVSIEKSEQISQVLSKRGIKHEVLNAKNHTREAHIIAQAGRKGAVTIATNMAGRGTDIKLGGNFEELATTQLIKDGEDPTAFSEFDMRDRYPELYAEVQAEHDEVLTAGGLHVIGTERHESRRIDNQLRGRSGRQGDAGVSKFFLSLDDDLMRKFGSERIIGVMDKLGAEEGEVISHPFVSGAVSKAQKRVEGRNFEIRKHLKEYDDVMNLQRTEIYALRRAILEGDNLVKEINDQFAGALEDIILKNTDEKNRESWNVPELKTQLATVFGITLDDEKYDLKKVSVEELFDGLWNEVKEYYEAKRERIGLERIGELEQYFTLQVIDDLWKDHLYEMDHLRDGVQYRSFGQKNPLYEYQREGLTMFEELRVEISQKIANFLFRFELQEREQVQQPRKQQQVVESHADASQMGSGGQAAKPAQAVRSEPKVGRNDPCPCGSGKKYKKCHGKDF